MEFTEDRKKRNNDATIDGQSDFLAEYYDL